MKLLVLIALFLPMTAMADKDATEVEEFLEGAKSDIEGVDFEILEKLRKKSSSIFEEKKKPIMRSTITPSNWEEAPFRAILKAGSLVRTLEKNEKDQKYYRTGKAIYVWAQRMEGTKRSYILTKNKKIKYSTQSRNLESVEEDLQLLPKEVPASKEAEAAARLLILDKQMNLKGEISLSYESINSSYMASIFRGNSTSAIGRKIDLNLYHISSLPIHVGLVASLSQGSWYDQRIGRANWSALLVGPTLQYNWKRNWSIGVNYQKSLVHTSEKAPEEHSFSTSSWQIHISRDLKTRIGNFFVGGGFRSFISSVEKSTEYLEQQPKRKASRAFMLLAGYEYPFKL